MTEKVRYKDTAYFRFKPERFDGNDWVAVMPNSYEAWLETPEVTPEQLAPLEVTYGNDDYYYVKFYAGPETYSEIAGGKSFYVAFYWTYNSVKLAKRITVLITPF